MNAERAGLYAIGTTDLRQHLGPALPQPSNALKGWSVAESDLPALRVKAGGIALNRRLAELVQVERARERLVLRDGCAASMHDAGADDTEGRCSIVIRLGEELKMRRVVRHESKSLFKLNRSQTRLRRRRFAIREHDFQVCSRGENNVAVDLMVGQKRVLFERPRRDLRLRNILSVPFTRAEPIPLPL